MQFITGAQALAAYTELQPILKYQPHRGLVGYHLSRAPLEILSAGNRFGKTTGMVAEGCMAGQMVHPVEGKYRCSTSEMPFRWRYISEPEILGGVVQPIIMNSFPPDTIKAGRTDQTGKFFESFHIHGFNPNDEEYWIEIEFRNNGSPVATFAGTWFDLISCDEPFSEEIYYENRSRISASGFPLRIHIGWTALDEANWAESIIYDSPDFNDVTKIYSYEGSTWNNCRCLEPEKHGGDCRCHGGYIPKDEITKLENDIKRVNPLQYEARILGKRMGGSRSIFQGFNRDVHIFKPDEAAGWTHGLPSKFTIWIGIDPHGGKPDFVQFWIVDPSETMYQMREFPDFNEGHFAGLYYDRIQGNPTTTTALAEILLEGCLALTWPRVVIGGIALDPHFTISSVKNISRETRSVAELINEDIRKLNEKHPELPNLPMVDTVQLIRDDGREIDSGIRKINEDIYYDHEQYKKDGGLKKGNMPKKFWSIKCSNSIRMMQGFKRAKPSAVSGSSNMSNRYEEEMKHAPDTTRYVDAMQPHYIRYIDPQTRFEMEYRNALPTARCA